VCVCLRACVHVGDWVLLCVGVGAGVSVCVCVSVCVLLCLRACG